MPIVDERGRLFGRVNLIDLGVATLVVAIAVGLYVGYSVFRMPPAPEVESVEPARQQAGNQLRLQLRGKNFLPFMRVYLQRTDAAGVVHEADPAKPGDAYTLVNSTQARFFVESPTLAEVRLPDEIVPGTYDLAFYNETALVAVKRGAFTLTPAPPPPTPAPVPTATLRIFGAFTGLDRDDLKNLTPGSRTTGASSESAEVLSAEEPRSDVVPFDVGNTEVAAAVDRKLRLPAVLRLHCTVSGRECRMGAAVITSRGFVQLAFGGKQYIFALEDVEADQPEAVRNANVSVRVVTRPETATLLKVGDIDRRVLSPNDRNRHFATIKSLGARREFASRTQLALTDVGQGAQTFGVEETVASVDAVLSVPLTRTGGVWFYKGQPIKAGGAMLFETTTYAVRGWILTVTVPQ